MKMVPLGEVLTSSASGYWGQDPQGDGADVHVIRNGDIKDDGVRWGTLPRRSLRPTEVVKSQVHEGDILLTTSGDCGQVAMVKTNPKHPTCATNFVRVLRFDGSVVPRYAFHYLSSRAFRASLAPYIRGTTLKNLSTREAFSAVRFPQPGVDEQRRIAAILDQAGALRARRRQVLAYLDALPQAIFHEMFGDVRTNEYGLAEATVGDVAERVTDGEHKTPRRSDDGVPLLSARNVRDGWIDFDNTDFVDEDEYAALSRRIEPREGDVLISCSGTIGRVAQVRGQQRFAMVRSAALVRPGSSVDPTFLARLLSSPTLRATMVAHANSSAQANLFQHQIKRLPVFLPSLESQHEFAARVDGVGAVRALLHRTNDADDELFASLQSRAFRGEL